MNVTDQLPDLATKDAELMARIGYHEMKREKLKLLQLRIDKMIEYRTRMIRELGLKRRVELTFTLPNP